MSGAGSDDDLLTAYFDGSLAPEQVAELDHQLQRDPELRARFWQEAMFARQLRSELAEPIACSRRVRARRRLAAALVAAAVLLGLGGWWFTRLGRGMTGTGAVQATEQAVETRCPDGSRLLLAPGSILEPRPAATGLRYRLVRGTATAEVVDRAGRGPFVIAGEHLEARVVGTRFRLITDADMTSLRVDEGVVDWVEPLSGETGRITAGQEHFALRPEAVAKLVQAASGIDLRRCAEGPWRRLDDGGTWRLRQGKQSGGTRPVELVIPEVPAAAGCYALVFTEARSSRIKVWPHGLTSMSALAPVPSMSAAADACQAAVRDALDRVGLDASATIVLVAVVPLGEKFHKQWYGVQFSGPRQRFLTVGHLKGVRVVGTSEQAVRPDAVLWSALAPEL
ncbi:MAG: FecR domain-containing protein [Planctomycetota bacterium]